MSTTDEVSAFLAGGSSAKSCSFPAIGDVHRGEIISMKVRQDTDMVTNEPKFFPSGDPMNVLVIELQTDEVDPEVEDDDGRRTLWVKFKMRDAVKEATTKAGSPLEVGGTLAVKFVRQDKPARRGVQGVKHYKAIYKAPDPAQAFLADGADEAEDDEFVDETPAPRANRAAKAKAAAPKASPKRAKPAPEPEPDDEDDEDDEFEDEPPAPKATRAKAAAPKAAPKRARAKPAPEPEPDDEDDEDDEFAEDTAF